MKKYQNNFQEHNFLWDLKIAPFFPCCIALEKSVQISNPVKNHILDSFSNIGRLSRKYKNPMTGSKWWSGQGWFKYHVKTPFCTTASRRSWDFCTFVINGRQWPEKEPFWHFWWQNTLLDILNIRYNTVLTTSCFGNGQKSEFTELLKYSFYSSGSKKAFGFKALWISNLKNIAFYCKVDHYNTFKNYLEKLRFKCS